MAAARITEPAIDRNIILGALTSTRKTETGLDFFFFMYDIQHCFICRPSGSTVSEDAWIEPRTVSTTALTDRRSASNHSARSHPLETEINKYEQK
jgi:hypothetical protein